MKRFSERKRSTIAVIVIVILFLIAGYIEVKADVVIAVPTDGDQQRDSSTVIVDQKDGGQKMIHCLSTETGLIYCMEL